MLNIVLSGGTTLVWDGRNDSGQIVSNGQYFISVHSDDGLGGVSTVTKEVTVHHPELNISSGKVLVYPNPDSVRVNGTNITFAANGNPPVTLDVNIYTITGELVTRLTGQPGTSSLIWDFSATSLASGLYLADIEIHDGQGAMERQISKLLIIH